MLEYIEENNILEKVRDDSTYLQEELEKLKQRFPLIGDVRGIGLLWGIELVTDRATKAKAIREAEAVMYECLHNGLSFKVSQGNVLQLSPPLIISRAQLSATLKILEHALETVSGQC
jgi:4-aminobutyrate aminotransferase